MEPLGSDTLLSAHHWRPVVRVSSLNILLIALTTGLLMGKWRTFTLKQTVSLLFACEMRLGIQLMD